MTIVPKVADFYHEDREPDFHHLRSLGIIGVIHKATEGRTEVDPAYDRRIGPAEHAGMLWGSYHFIRPGDVARQVYHFLEHADHEGLLVLDWEDPLVGMWSALRFLELIRLRLNVTPWLYAGGLLRGRTVSPVFSEFPLWLSEYSERAIVPLPWKRYTLWQYTEHGHEADDLSHFDGTDAELRALWPGGHRQSSPNAVASTEPKESKDAEHSDLEQSDAHGVGERSDGDLGGAGSVGG